MLVLMLLIWPLSFAQQVMHECGTELSDDLNILKSQNCNMSQNAWNLMYKLPQRYIPNANNLDIGIKTIPINLVVFGEDDSTGFPISQASFSLDSALFSSWLNQAFVVNSNIFLSPQSTTIIPLSGLKSGIYILKCSDEKGNVQTHKIIKN